MTVADPSALPYRRGVGAVLFNRVGRVFVARRIDTPGEAWQLPQGGIHHDEKPRAALFRELAEEIGTDRAEVIARSRRWLRYDLPADLVTKVWRGRYRGQEQRWYALRFTGTDADIDLNAHRKPEFAAWRWSLFEELPTMAVGFKRKLYHDLVNEFHFILEDPSALRGQA